MEVLDKRSLESTDDLFEALFEHINFAYNGGNIRSTISVFNAQKGIRIMNPQLLGFAAYKQKDGSIIGDPKHLEVYRRVCETRMEAKNGSL